MHARAGDFLEGFADSGLGRMFGDLPGKDRLVQYLKGRAGRELAKLSEERLAQYLQGLEGLMRAIRTGEDYEEYRTLAATPPEEEVA